MHQIFFAPGEFQNPPRYTEDDLKKAIATLRNAPLQRHPLSDYKGAIDNLWQYGVSSEAINALRRAAANNPAQVNEQRLSGQILDF